jgi:hypothetical protein
MSVRYIGSNSAVALQLGRLETPPVEKTNEDHASKMVLERDSCLDAASRVLAHVEFVGTAEVEM